MRFLLLLIFPCTVFAHEAHKHHEKPAKGIVSLDVYKDGETIHVLTGEADAIFYRRSTGISWTKPQRINPENSKPSGLRPGNDAQVAASGDNLVALWPVAGTGWGGGGPFVTALSADGGKSWRPGPTPADTGSTAGHGFADLLFDAQGLHVVWLDSRDKSQGLRYARSVDRGASWSANVSIAPNSCECCWNTLARGSVLHVMYRGKGPRDMSLASMSDGAWTRRGAVAPFNWDIKGCPETGGGLVVAPDGAMHALSWTGLTGKEGLYYTSSRDGGARWSAPARMGTQAAQHSDLAVSADGNLGAVWDDDGAIRFARSRDGGRSWSKAEEASRKADAASHPRIAWAPKGFLLLWTERGKGGIRELRTTIRQ